MTRTTLRLTAALAALLVAGCGMEERPEPAAPAKAPATPAPPPGGGSPADSFPERPQFADDFAQADSGWPRSGYRAGGFHLRRREGTVGASAPRSVDPANRGTLLEAVVEAPPGGGAGLLCRASEDYRTGYALLLYGRSRIQLVRLQDGDATTLKAHTLTPNERSDRGAPTLLRLGCGSGEPGRPVTLSYTVNATPYGFVVDRTSLDPGDAARVGLVARDGAARFDDFALWLAA